MAQDFVFVKGVSPAISTIIITAALLMIFATAFHFAVNFLEIQLQNSEFEQAKTAMLLLDRTIIDVSLRRGAASSIPFNQRSGGIGIYEGGPMTLTIFSNGTYCWGITIQSYVLKYRGGSMVSAVEVNLTNPGGIIINETSKPLGFIRVEVGHGVWIVLDYNRVRVTINQDLGFLDIYLIRLKPGVFGGSGSVTVKVQNEDVKVAPIPLGGRSTVKLRVDVGGLSEERDFEGISLIRVMEVVEVVSIM